jgi:GTPase
MSRLATVAIIGRPNTGKSTLFNRMVGQRLAIENEIAGTTRDQIAAKAENEELDFLLVDTGGIGGGSTDADLEEDVSRQSVLALEAADLIVFTVNGREELTASDREVVNILRKQRKSHVPVVIAVTKCDKPSVEEERTGEYEALGITDDVVFTSAAHNMGLGELTDVIIAHLKKLHFTKEEKIEMTEATPPRIAFVGIPNVGKSSLVNALMSDTQRKNAARIVSPIPGTTRDSSDTVVRHDEKDYVFVDTAGLRRKARVEEDLEYLSNIRSVKAIADSDITVLVLDAKLAISKQEKRIVNMAASEGKGLIVIVNKADLMDADEKKEKQLEVQYVLKFCKYAPVLFTSAQTRENLPKIFTLIETVARNRNRRIVTRDLRRWFEGAVQRAPSKGLSRCKFLTQAEEVPPTFVLFVPNPKEVTVAQLRFLENSMRETFAFEGTPIRMITKKDEERARRTERPIKPKKSRYAL